MKKMKSGKWTGEEILFLKNNYAELDFEELKKELNRTKKSIELKAFKLQVKRKSNWTKEEVSFLESNYEDMTNKEMAVCIDREPESVKNKLKRMGLKRAFNLIGQKHGKLTVVGKTDSVKSGSVLWRCECECGNETFVNTRNLKNNHTKSCGCLHKEAASKNGRKNASDYIGKSFGKLTVINKTDRRKGSDIAWECLCDCGGKTVVSTSHLTLGRTRSCGKGKCHWNYNHELTDEERVVKRYMNEYVIWRTAVFKRDNYTCCVCNTYNGTHNAHHLNGWNAYPEERFDLENGITLCELCHRTFHGNYCYGKKKKKQFYEFKKKMAVLK